MAKMKVTLKSNIKSGEFYWVTTVNADSEEEAITAAEHLFISILEKNPEWEFDEFEVVPSAG